MNRKSGLTYLELLIVLMLLAVVSTLIGGAFDFVRQAQKRAIIMEAREEQIILRSLLREWVENMSPIVAENGFTGTAEGFSFVYGKNIKAKPQAQDIAVELQINDRHVARLFLTGLDRNGQTVFDESRSFEPDLRSGSLSYYGSKSNGPARWHDVWQEGRLPRLIRFQATRANGDPMPPLIIRPTVAYNQSLISALFPSPPT